MRLSDAFLQSADIEDLAASLYGRFAEDWARDSEVAAFWRRMSRTEALHAASLRAAAARLETKGHATTVDLSIGAIRGFMDAMTTEIGDKSLDQAFRIALEIESLELDRVYRGLIDRGSPEVIGFGLFAEDDVQLVEHDESLLAIIEARSRDAGLLAEVRRHRARRHCTDAAPLGATLQGVFDGFRRSGLRRSDG